jgi:hypothetical protein
MRSPETRRGCFIRWCSSGGRYPGVITTFGAHSCGRTSSTGSVCVTTLAAGAAWVTISLCGLASHWLSSLAAVLVAWTTLAMRGLDNAAKTVELSLRRDDENNGRTSPVTPARKEAHGFRSAIQATTFESPNQDQLGESHEQDDHAHGRCKSAHYVHVEVCPQPSSGNVF